MKTPTRIFQIFYNDITRAAVDPAFEPLDNSGNERPDWFEYWPIQNFLKQQSFEDGFYYGFFSPKFGQKTRLTGEAVRSFVAASEPADIISFSPFPEQACFFRNIFEQGEMAHPGLLDISKAFFKKIGFAFDPENCLMDTRTTIYCNYFVAKGRFWRRWNEIFQQCFAHAEDICSPLHAPLTSLTRHDKTAQMKIFLMERIASALLLTTGGLEIRNYAPFGMPLANPRFIPAFGNIIAMDALKMAYAQTREVNYLKSFDLFRDLTIKFLNDHQANQLMVNNNAGDLSGGR